MNRKAKFAVRTVAALFAAIGFIGFLAGPVITLSVVKIPDWFEMPLGALEGITLDSDGNIYCSVGYYSRVQVYNSEGDYTRGKFVDSAEGALRIRNNQKDEL